MSVQRFCLVAGLSAQLAACSAIESLSFQKADNTGMTENQKVTVAYLSGRKLSNFDLNANTIPQAIVEECRPTTAQMLQPAVVAGLAVAGFDALLGTIDGYRARLKERAVKTYSATPVVTTISFGEKLKPCIVTERRVGEKGDLAMVMVNTLESFKTETDAVGFAWRVAYLRVDQAAAETAKVEGKQPAIKLTQSIAIAALQPRVGGGQASEIVATASFDLSGIEIGKGYAHDDYFPKKKAGAFLCAGKKVVVKKDGTAEEVAVELCHEILEPGLGPIFPPLRQSGPTVGSVNVTVTERGSAADLKDVGAVEAGLRTAIRSALGKEIEARLSN